MVLLLDLMACLWKIQTFKEKFNNNWTFSATQSYCDLFVDAANLLHQPVASEEEDEPRSCADVMVCIVVCSSSCNTWCIDACLLSVVSFTQHDNSFSLGDYIVAMDPIDGGKKFMLHYQ
jgi:hypothetical protein